MAPRVTSARPRRHPPLLPGSYRMPHPQKFLVIGLDGFRPELISESLTPHLHAFAAAGVDFRHHRCTFPSETYVNLPSLVTGAAASGHGIVANSFLAPGFDRRRAWEGGRSDHVEAHDVATGGHLFTTPSLGELLGDAGRRMVVVSCNPVGGARLKHHRAGRYAGHLCLSTVDWRASQPSDAAAALVAALGEPPSGYDPASVAARQTWATDAWLADARLHGVPDIGLIWFEEPDESFHAYGIGDARSLGLIAHVDAEVGRLVEWWQSHPEHDRINLLLVSDHAHITQTARLDVAALLADAGLNVAPHFEDGADYALLTGYCGHLRVRDGERRLLARAADALMQHPGVGLVFSGPGNGTEGAVAGTLDRALLGAAHARSPDLYFVLRAGDDIDPYGLVGTCLHDNDLKDGAGIHGGLHPRELNNLLLARGAMFREGFGFDLPSGIVDIAPTLLAGLGLPAPASMQGRTLRSALAVTGEDEGEAVEECFESGAGDFAQRLRRTRFAGSVYLEGATRL